MATHIQKISMCSSKTSLLISVMPLVMFNANQSALITGTNKNASKRVELLVRFLKNLKNIVCPKCVSLIKNSYSTL